MPLLDFLALILYLLVILSIGFYFSKSNKAFADFMFGGGKMPWWAIGISLIATSVSATTFLGNPADVFAKDMTYLMLNIGAFLSIAIIAVVFIPRFKGLGVQSAYEILEQRFSRGVRLMAAWFYSCHLLLRTGILIYGPAIVLSSIFNINIYLSICLMAILSITYTYFGGLKAVVWTDVIQFFVLFGGGLLTLYFCAKHIGGLSEMAALASEAGKTTWFRFGMDPREARNLLSAGIVYLVFETAIRGCDQQFVQRYLACADVTRANLSSALSALLGLLVGLVFYWVGAALFVYFKVAAIRTLPEEVGVNHVFPYFILEVLPPGVTGLLVAAIFAAAMSSLDSAITALANTTVIDLRVHKGDNDRHRLALAKKWVIIWGVAGMLAGFLCVSGEQSILTKALFFTSLFTGPLLGMFLLAFFRPNMPPKAVITGAVGGMVLLAAFSKIPFLPDSLWTPIYRFSWPWNPVISLSGMLLIALVTQALLPRNATS